MINVLNFQFILLFVHQLNNQLELRTYVSIHNLFVGIGSAQDFTPGIDQHGIAVALVSSTLRASRRYSSNKALRVDGTSAHQKFPVQRAGCHIKGARIKQHAAA